MDNQVTIQLIFHVMGDDPQEAVQRCLDYLNPQVSHSVEPYSMTIIHEPK